MSCVFLELNFFCEHRTCLDYEYVKECHAAFCSHHNSTRTQARRKKKTGEWRCTQFLSLAHQLDALSGARAAYQANVQQFTVPRGVFCIFCRVTFCPRRERKTRVFSLGHCATHVKRWSLGRTHASMRKNTRIFASGERRTPLIKVHEVMCARPFLSDPSER